MKGFASVLLANSNIEKSLVGLGALKGAPCVLSNIEEILDADQKVIGNRLTFTWTGTDGSTESRSFDVMNGKDGSGAADLKDITEAEINEICVIQK